MILILLSTNTPKVLSTQDDTTEARMECIKVFQRNGDSRPPCLTALEKGIFSQFVKSGKPGSTVRPASSRSTAQMNLEGRPLYFKVCPTCLGRRWSKAARMSALPRKIKQSLLQVLALEHKICSEAQQRQVHTDNTNSNQIK